MHRIARAAAIAWLSVGCGSPGEIPGVSREAVAKAVEEACPKIIDPALYRVDKDGETSWLLGTRHTSVALGKFPLKLLIHIQSAKTVVFEIAPDVPGAPEASPAPYAGKPLRELLGDARWEKYRTIVGDRIAGRTTSPLQAAAALVMLYENLDVTLEAELAHFARDAHVPAQGLETHTFQRELLTDNFATELGEMIDSSTREKLQALAMTGLHAYCAGTEDETVASLNDKLGTERNKTWLPKLEALHAAGGAFVAVGAGHLRGPDGLVALLRDDGYTVTRTLDD